MKITKKHILIILSTTLMAALSGCNTLLDSGTTTNIIQASGVVEAIEVGIASELGGRVDQVFVSEGDRVEPGDPLFQIEDVLLQAQLQQAGAAYRIAQANYDLTAAGMTNEEKNAAISSAELELASAQYDLNKLGEDTDLLAAQALSTAENLGNQLEDLLNFELQQALVTKAIADAQKTVDNAERRARTVISTAGQADMEAAKAQVVLA
jgi:HlyD family secretion protein